MKTGRCSGLKMLLPLFVCAALVLFSAPIRAAGESKTVYQLTDSLTQGQTYLLVGSDTAGESCMLAAQGDSLVIQWAEILTDGQTSYLEEISDDAKWVAEENGKLKNADTGYYLRYTAYGPQLTTSATKWTYDANYGLSYSGKYLDLAGGTEPVLTDGDPNTRVWLYTETTITLPSYSCADDAVVADFGLPMDIHVLENDTLPEGTSLSGVSAGQYGTAEIAENCVRYTPSMHFPGVDTVTYTTSSGHTGTVCIIPAPEIFYEEEHLTYTDGGAAWQKIAAGEEIILQREDTLGCGNIYGADPAYESGLTYSLGTARSVSVDDRTGGSAPSVSFSFTGTGFELISATGRASGLFLTEVTELGESGEEDTVLYRWAVDGYWDGEETLYQIPVLKSPTLPYGTYQVTITPVYAAFFDHDETVGYSLCIDGVRIYGPAQGLDEGCYALDSEGWSRRVELRDELMRTGGEGGTLLTEVTFDGKDMSLFDHCLQPNNELYLYPEQSLSFELTLPEQEGLELEVVLLAAKALTKAAVLSVAVEDNALEWAVESASPMFRTLLTGGTGETSLRVCVANRGSAPVCLTELKFTYRKGGAS